MVASQTRYRLFNITNLDLPNAVNKDDWATNAWVLAKDNEFYVVYTKDASAGVSLKLPVGACEL
ncbi:hypothetical protein [Psychrosphaera algicola]|uniref:Uncharacterized protein n=1 Tax=Psychrosphaera algicola TaxID=3023714 RepID=A0ABT5F7R1_9GAMM|nr:hypothetical protein [Psychrosphaera sp. G1-22]MDC2887568.1 hypothetical protein [Psychrosphaera sp. G1-22]